VSGTSRVVGGLVDTGQHGRRPGIEILTAIPMKFRCDFSSDLLLMLGNCVLGGRAYLL
jgi:hypothetical protein